MEESDLQMEAVAEWAKKTWPANLEIAENIRNSGLSGSDLAGCAEDDELMEELGIKTKAKKIVFRNTWSLMKPKKSAQLRKKVIINELEKVRRMMTVIDRKSIQENLENQKTHLQLKNGEVE